MESTQPWYDDLVEQMLEVGVGLEGLLVMYGQLLRALDEEGVRSAVLRLWASVDWSTRRALIARLEGPEHAALVPELAELAPALGASGRADVVRALERIGSVAGEPVLEHLLRTSAPSVRVLVTDVLAELGTRQSVGSLRRELDVAREPIYTASLLNALDKIEARHPVNARQGSLTLAEDGRAGALSLAGATAGEVTLYEHALARLEPAVRGAEAEEEAEEEPSRALVVRKGQGMLELWQGLAPAPRARPPLLSAYAFTSDHVGVILVLAGMMSVLSFSIMTGAVAENYSMTSLPYHVAWFVGVAGTVLGPTALPLWAFLRWRSRHERLTRFITQGEYATARMLPGEVAGGVEYVDPQGALRQGVLDPKEGARYRPGDRVPVLVEGDDLLALSSHQGIVPRADGALSLRVASPGVMLLGVLVAFLGLPCVLVAFILVLGTIF
jgi:hypothetical protein